MWTPGQAVIVEHATGVHATCRNLLLLTPSRKLTWVPTAPNGHINHVCQLANTPELKFASLKPHTWLMANQSVGYVLQHFLLYPTGFLLGHVSYPLSLAVFWRFRILHTIKSGHSAAFNSPYGLKSGYCYISVGWSANR
jgi:hypothetical protein